MDEIKQRATLIRKIEKYQSQFNANERKLKAIQIHRESSENTLSENKMIQYKLKCEEDLKRGNDKLQEEKNHWNMKLITSFNQIDKEIEDIEKKIEEYRAKQLKNIEILNERKRITTEHINLKLREKESVCMNTINYYEQEIIRVNGILDNSVKKGKLEIALEIEQTYIQEEICKLKQKINIPLSIDIIHSKNNSHSILQTNTFKIESNTTDSKNITEMEIDIIKLREESVQYDRNEIKRIEDEKKNKQNMYREREIRYKAAVKEIQDREDKLPHESAERKELSNQRKKLRLENF